MRSWTVHLALVVVQVLFATLPVAIKFALREIPAPALALIRVAGAATLFFLVHRLLVAERVVGWRDYARLAMYALFGVVLNQLLYITALTMTTATVAQTIVTTGPAMTLLVAIVLRRETATLGKWLGIACAGAGALYLLGVEVTGGSALGNGMVLLNVAAFSFYLVLSRDMVHRYDPLTIITWVFLIGAIGLAPWGIPSAATGIGDVSRTALLAVAWIVTVPTVGGYYLNVWALRRVEASVVAIYVYLQPVVTALLAVPLLGEELSPRMAPAVALIFTGVGISAYAGVRAKRAARRDAAPDPAEQLNTEV